MYRSAFLSAAVCLATLPGFLMRDTNLLTKAWSAWHGESARARKNGGVGSAGSNNGGSAAQGAGPRLGFEKMNSKQSRGAHALACCAMHRMQCTGQAVEQGGARETGGVHGSWEEEKQVHCTVCGGGTPSGRGVWLNERTGQKTKQGTRTRGGAERNTVRESKRLLLRAIQVLGVVGWCYFHW